MKINSKVIYRKIDEEYYVLEPKSNTFINFNEIGNFIFSKIVDGRKRQEIIEEITNDYSVDSKTAENDFEEFLKELKELKIVD